MSNGRIGSPIFVDPINNDKTSIIRKVAKAHLAMVLSEKDFRRTSLSSPLTILITYFQGRTSFIHTTNRALFRIDFVTPPQL